MAEKEGNVMAYGLIKDLREHEQEKGTEEVDGCDGNVETVGLLVHPWAHDRHSNKEGSLDDNNSKALNLGAVLCKANEHGLDEQVCKPGDDEPVSGSLELDVEEA